MNCFAKPIIFRFLLLPLFSISIHAQKNTKVRFEDVKEKCKGLAQENKIRLSVSRFTVTTPNRGGEFGDNMATMLTNALQQTNCFRVLAQLKNLGDLKGEIEFSKSEDSNGEGGPEKGKMMAAQVVVTGEITEYSLQKRSFGVGIIKTNNTLAKIGFILQIINPQTRELISKSINVESKVSGGTSVGVRVPLFGDLNAGSGANEDPAIANALEQGIIEAIEYMSSEKEKIALLAPTNNITPSTDKMTVVTISNTDFTFLSSFSEALKTAPGVIDIQRSMTEGTGVLKIKHSSTADDLITQITKRTNDKASITGFSDGKIMLKVK